MQRSAANRGLGNQSLAPSERMPEEQGFTVNEWDRFYEACDVVYAIYDTQDNCWLGDEKGPKFYDRELSDKLNGMPQELAARIAAQMTAIQIGYPEGRLQARQFDKSMELVHRDSVDTKMTALKALRILEGCNDGSGDD
jgi:hypothetical protein